MKLKTRRTSGWVKVHTQRRLCMPQHQSTLPAEFAADAVAKRVGTFHWMKRINRIPKRSMPGHLLEQLFGGP